MLRCGGKRSKCLPARARLSSRTTNGSQQGSVERGTWDYVQGGSDGEVTLRENSAAFGRVRLRPRVAGAASGPRWIQGGVPRPDHHARARPSCRTGRVFRCGPHCRRSARREARATNAMASRYLRICASRTSPRRRAMGCSPPVRARRSRRTAERPSATRSRGTSSARSHRGRACRWS